MSSPDRLYEVLFDWPPENDDDLPIKVGDIVHVLEMKDGWWLGQLVVAGSTETSLQGYFPSNYVREKLTSGSPPKPPPRPQSSKKAIDEANSQLDKLAAEESSLANSADMIRTAGVPFSIESLDAFDDLMNLGFAIEYCGGAIKPDAATDFCVDGEAVEIELEALCWDGAENNAYPFCKGVLGVTVGKNQICKGLDKALLGVPKQARLDGGQQIRVICSPSKAYGDAGNPPLVPPNSSLVFIITSVKEISADAEFRPYGIEDLITNNNFPVNRKEANNINPPTQVKRRSVVLLKDDGEGKK